MVPQFINGEQISKALDYPSLIEKLRISLRHQINAPLRQTLIPRDGDLFLIMPAVQPIGDWIVKSVSITPKNEQRSLPTIHATVSLFDGSTGRLRAVLDGTVLTQMRTAAVSALASSYLSDSGSKRLAIIGTGAQAFHMAEAHASVRKIDEIRVWGRSADKAATLKSRLIAALPGRNIEVAADIEKAVRWADIVSVATMAREPIIKGDWLRSNTHLDLVGAHSPGTREVDDTAIIKSTTYVDFDSAFTEAGEIVIPIRAGRIDACHIRGTLSDLIRDASNENWTPAGPTVFKAVGNAAADLAAAELVWQRHSIRS